jgi:hypothetical protein
MIKAWILNIWIITPVQVAMLFYQAGCGPDSLKGVHGR